DRIIAEARKENDRAKEARGLALKGQAEMLKGQALAQRGQRTEGLLLYIQGLSHSQPGRSTGELLRQAQEPPAFKRPDILVPPNPALAEKQYALGLDRFWSCRYAEAEPLFVEATRAYDQDARYFYFLGLSRLLQGKETDAREDFRLAAQLELQG